MDRRHHAQDRLVDCSRFHLRRAALKDARLLWQWANDPGVRNRSFDTSSIYYDTHFQWYQAKLRSASTRIWIVEVTGIPAGQIRYERKDNNDNRVADIDISVATAFRGKGIGSWLLSKTTPLACSGLDVDYLEGVVFDSNLLSLGVFGNAGFHCRERVRIHDVDCIVFKKPCRSAILEGGTKR